MVWFLKKNCKKALYLALYFNPGLKNFHQFLYLKLCSENFYGNFQCLKVFELNLKLCWYNSFWEAGVNRRWSKHRFHPSVYGLPCLEKTWRCHLRKNLKKTLQKGKLWWKMENDCFWLATDQSAILGYAGGTFIWEIKSSCASSFQP